MDQTSPHITWLLNQWSAGDKKVLDDLVPLVYAELRRLAKLYSVKDASIQPTALVNEVYLRLIGTSSIHWENRAHFFAVAAQIMRRLLVDRHRAHIAAKRGGEQTPETLDSGVPAEAIGGGVDLLDLDLALNELEQMNPRGAQVIDLRFFAGLSLEEVADVTETSLATVKRDWAASRAWLKARLDSPAFSASRLAHGASQ